MAALKPTSNMHSTESQPCELRLRLHDFVTPDPQNIPSTRTVWDGEKARGMKVSMLNALPPPPQGSLSLSKDPKNEVVAHPNAIMPPFVSRF